MHTVFLMASLQIFLTVLDLKMVFCLSPEMKSPREVYMMKFVYPSKDFEIICGFCSLPNSHISHKKMRKLLRKAGKLPIESIWPVDISEKGRSEKTASELHNLQFIFRYELEAKGCPA